MNSIASVFDTDQNDSSVLFLKWLHSLAFAKFYCLYFILFFCHFLCFMFLPHCFTWTRVILGFFLDDCKYIEYELERFFIDLKIKLTSFDDLGLFCYFWSSVEQKLLSLTRCCLSLLSCWVSPVHIPPPSPTFQAGLMSPGMPVAQTRIVWVRKGSLTSSLHQGTTLSQRRHPNLSHPLLQARRSPGAAWWKITVQTRVAHPPQQGPAPLAARVVAVRCVAWPAAAI